MAQRVGGIEIGASANVERFAGDMRRMERVVAQSVGRMGRSFDTTAASVNRLNKASNFRFNSFGFIAAGRALGDVNRRADLLRTSLLSLTSVIGGFSLALVTNAVIEHADAYKELQNRIRVVTDSEEELKGVEAELFDIAMRSRAGLKETAVIYGRLALASKNLGTAQADLLRITETIQKAFQIGGATVVEATQSAIQLTQGIASNRLGGDELRSVLENVALARTLADQIAGGDVGKLRKMAQDGKVTAKVLLDAFLAASEGIDEAFTKIQPTIRQAFVVLDSAFTKFIGEQDQAAGASKVLVNALIGMANNIETVADSIILISGVLLTSYVTRALGRSIATTREFTTALAAARVATAAEAANVQVVAQQRVAATQAEATAINQKITALTLERRAIMENIAVSEAAVARSVRVVAAMKAGSVVGTTVSQTTYNKALQETVKHERDVLTSRAALAANSQAIIAANGQLRTATLAVGQAQTVAAGTAAAYGAALAGTSRAALFATTAMAGLSRVMAFFGGPVGFAITAVTAGLLAWSLRTDEATEAMRRHQETVGKVGIAYEKAGRNAYLFSRTASEALKFDIERSVRDLSRQLNAAVGTFLTPFDRLNEVKRRFEAFREPIETLSEGLRNGTPDIEAFQEAIAGIARGNPELEKLADTIAEWVENLKIGELAGDLKIAQAELRLTADKATEADLALLGLGDAAKRTGASFSGATSDVKSFAAGLKTLVESTRAGKEAAEIQEKLAQATADYSAALAAVAKENISEGFATTKVEKLRAAYIALIKELDGTAEAEKKAVDALEKFTEAGILSGLTEHEQKIFKLNQTYRETVEKLRAAKAGTDEFATAQANYNAQLRALGGNIDPYDAILNALKQMSPAFKEQVATTEELAQATNLLERAQAELQEMLAAGEITAAEYRSRLGELDAVYNSVKNSVTGFTRAQERAQEALEKFVDEAAMLGMTAQQQEIFRLAREYDDLVDKLTKAGASQQQLDQATRAFNALLGDAAGQVGVATERYDNLDGSVVRVTRHGADLGQQLVRGLSPLADAITSAGTNYDELRSKIGQAREAQETMGVGVGGLRDAYGELGGAFDTVGDAHEKMTDNMLIGLAEVLAAVHDAKMGYQGLGADLEAPRLPRVTRHGAAPIQGGGGARVGGGTEAGGWDKVTRELALQNGLLVKVIGHGERTADATEATQSTAQTSQAELVRHGATQSAIQAATEETAEGIGDVANALDGMRVTLLNFGTSIEEALAFLAERDRASGIGGTQGRPGSFGTIYDQGNFIPRHQGLLMSPDLQELIKLRRDLEWYLANGAKEEQLKDIRARIAELEFKLGPTIEALGNLGNQFGTAGLFPDILDMLGLKSGGSFKIGGSVAGDNQPIVFRGTPGEEVMVFNDHQQRVLDSIMDLADSLKEGDRQSGNTTINNQFDLAVHIDPIEDTAAARQRAREFAEMVQAEMAR